MSSSGADLVARDAELARLARLVADAREGVSGALALAGPPGIGKTALVDATTAMAEGFAVLRARGVEGEAGLPYATLSQLLLRVIDLRSALEPAERAALEGALALGPAGDYDALAVGGAVVGLLAAVAEERPVLAIIDDLHWADVASVAALRVVAGRLGGEGIALLVATRPERPTPDELETLRLGPLPETAARALIARTSVRLGSDAERRVLETAGGNPLALLEIPALLHAEGTAAGSGPALKPLPAGPTLEAALRAPLERLPEPTRRALLLAAVDEHAPRAVLDVALAHAGLDASALLAAEQQRLVVRADDGVTFRHPLIRSAVYHGASGPERRSAHAALAVAWPRDTARWAWHAAGATLGPDEEVAASLETLAAAASARGAHDAAQRTWRRAAELSPDPSDRFRRRLLGAGELLRVGAMDECGRLLDLARDEKPPGEDRKELELLQGRLELRRDNPQRAYRALVDVADRLADTDPERAAEVLLEASIARMMAGDVEGIWRTGLRALDLIEGRYEVIHTAAQLITAQGLVVWGGTGEGEAMMREGAARAKHLNRTPPSVEGVAQAAHIALLGELYEEAEAILDWLERAARLAGAAGNLGMPLAVRARMLMRQGRLTDALSTGYEALELSEQTGQQTVTAHALGTLAEIESMLGRADDCRAHAARALELAHGQLADLAAVYPLSALGALEYSLDRLEPALDALGRADQALERLGLTDPAFLPVRQLHIEALTRAGEHEEASRLLDEYEARIHHHRRHKWLPAVARSRALLAGDDEYEELYAQALELHGPDASPFAEARTLLQLGARRRRARRRGAAREPLQRALEVFERLGTAVWAAQARRELELAGAATGADARTATPPALDELTPQELRVALSVGRGMSNRQVAGTLFVSTRTVEAHLRQIYRKLDLRSRTELARLVAGLDGPGSG